MTREPSADRERDYPPPTEREEPAARRDYPPPAQDRVVERPEVISLAMDRDGVRWGPVWAGLLTALSLFVLFSLLAAAVGLATFDPGAEGQAVRVQTGGIVGAAIALLSFLLGGMVAGRTAATPGRGGGALNGFLVWALGLVLILAFAAFGLGQLFGAAGDLFGQFRQVGVGTLEAGQLEQIQAGALGAFLGVLLMAVAATLGGLLGGLTRPDREV